MIEITEGGRKALSVKRGASSWTVMRWCCVAFANATGLHASDLLSAELPSRQAGYSRLIHLRFARCAKE